MLNLFWCELVSPLTLGCKNEFSDVLAVDIPEGSCVIETRLSCIVNSEGIEAGIEAVANHVDISALDS